MKILKSEKLRDSMAYILCLETSTTVCSVALARDGRLLALREINAGYSHSENITKFIGEVCSEGNIELKNLDAIAVSKGPGSYTGLRIGVSTAKGLCYALDKPLIAVETLKSLAGCCLHSNVLVHGSLLVPMLDARRMEVYAAVFDSTLKEISPVEPVIVTENSFHEILRNQKAVFFGDGSAKCKPLFENNPNVSFVDVTISATGMISLAEEKFAKKEFEDVSLFEPFYLKEAMVGMPAR
ncbi:MAG: tRNA (adenosine(37)-N6)-threonylcarbamoyltransferase complex dimerization subunit type 1 TsaB [Bacteroidota bacterium]